MNRSFEAALAARWLWMDVRWLESIGGLEREVEAAILTAYAAVDEMAEGETWGEPRYGANIPPLLLDVPQLAARYKMAFESCLEAERVLVQEFEFQQEREQYLSDLADTYAEIERDLIAGWKEDCRDDGHL